jgi:hypothetical protein
MANETTYKGKLGDWEQLTTMLAENSTELPHLEASRLKLEEFLKQGLDIAAKQAMLRADKQDASQQMKALISNGQRLTKLLRLAVKEHYGIRSEKLTAYGMQPFRGRKAKAKPEPTEPPAPPAPAEPLR